MISEPIAPLCTCEIAGRVRGKGFPVTDLSARLKSCIGWMPTNTIDLGAWTDRRHGLWRDGEPDPRPRSGERAQGGFRGRLGARQFPACKRRLGAADSEGRCHTRRQRIPAEAFRASSLNVAWISTTSSAVHAGSTWRMRLRPTVAGADRRFGRGGHGRRRSN